MAARKITISLTEELDAALTLASLEARDSKSSVIEIYLREHPRVKKLVDEVRSEPDTTALAVGSHARKAAQEKYEPANLEAMAPVKGQSRGLAKKHAKRVVSSSGKGGPTRGR